MIKVMHMLHPLEVEVGELTSTVRLGFKWAGWVEEIWAAEEGGWVRLCVCKGRCQDPDRCGLGQTLVTCDNCTASGEGDVHDLWVGKFSDIPARQIANEHEVASRSYAGLAESLDRAYGNKFTPESLVTIVTYLRTA